MAQRPRYAEVVVEIADRKVDRPFHYHILPEHRDLVQTGVRVVVPFGRRQIKGYVVGISPQADVEKTKPILTVLTDEPPIRAELLQLARWMAAYYMCPLVTVLQAFFPKGKLPGDALAEEWASLAPTATVSDLAAAGKGAPKQREILKQLQLLNPMPVRQLLLLAGADRRSLTGLLKKGVVRVDLRDAQEEAPAIGVFEALPSLTPDQKQALSAVKQRLVPPGFEVFLLHGVTGSGKTEVYLQSIARTIAAGYQAIVLFPEIALATHLIESFQRRFRHQVEVLHSGLTARQRLLTIHRISQGLVPIVVGTRSAVFAPVPRLGLIILDEEHETSYQQDVTPKYHAREVAIIRAFLNKIPVILGSATPSLESYYKASQKKFTLLKMGSRVAKKSLPQVTIIDFRQEQQSGNTTLFGRVLQNKLQERLLEGEQSIIFLNRRGYANFFNCRDCGHVIKCKHCDVSLTYYGSKNQLKCHYCNYTEGIPAHCPVCGGERIRPLGAGTEKVEAELKSLLPAARVVRIDSDTIRKKGDYEEKLDLFAAGRADIMIGTQMIAKGLDFPGVTLVGVILADQMLNFPDFRARERTFQLLTQVAGRAGRGPVLGEVVVQTFNPDHSTIRAAAQHDYEQFFAEEIKLRHLLRYPPFSHLIRLLITGREEARCERGSQLIGEKIRRYSQNTEMSLLGPVPAPLTKINDLYRWQLLVKGPDIKKMRGLVGLSLRETAAEGQLPAAIRINLDIDPMGIL